MDARSGEIVGGAGVPARVYGDGTMTTRDQIDLFGARPALPQGLRYAPDVLDAATEAELIERIRPLPLREFEFHGFLGKRRVLSYGYRYDYSKQAAQVAEPLPPFLLELREVAARFAAVPADSLVQSSVLEYAPGSQIGWHRDKGVFGVVLGISLLSPCRFRLRRRVGPGWERYAFTAEPRSAYVLQGSARHEWEHSIPPVPELRYSITFRQKLPA